MNDVGHLYVLANSAMPGLVKVGKTTRSPTERAAELSSTTGLPTPFIVVYEQLFSDCSEAELFVHTYLATKGFRVSDNREFFNAPVNVVVRGIALAPGAIDGEDSVPGNESWVSNELRFETSLLAQQVPWTSVFKEAEDYYYGLGETLQDDKRALKLYVQAIKLGSLPAYSRVASMYMDGRGVKAYEGSAVRFLKDGSEKGSFYCYWAMALLSLNANSRAKKYLENADKYFSFFLKKLGHSHIDSPGCTKDQWSQIDLDCVGFVSRRHRYHTEPPEILKNFLLTRSMSIRLKAESMLNACRKTGLRDGTRFYQAVLDDLNSSLPPPEWN